VHFKLKEYLHPDFNAPEFANAPEASLLPAVMNGAAPEGYHTTTIFPEYFKVHETWLLAEKSRMDCVAVLEGTRILVKELRNIKQGDMIFIGCTENGEQGIYVHANAFLESQNATSKGNGNGNADSFAFRQGRSRETSFSMDYDTLYEQLRYEKENGYIVWVVGPACVFDADSRKAFSRLCANGYVHAMLAGNALAVHDLEGSYKNSALGQDIYTQITYEGGHCHHLDTINRVRQLGSIPAFIREENITEGVMYQCVENNIPYVLAGSIRDDGPLPGVFTDAYKAQDAMREHASRATVVICMATTLHAIATGNMTPSFRVMPDGSVRQVYFYVVDISEFAANKLRDRGSLSAKSIITNVQDFVTHCSRNLMPLLPKDA